MQVRVRLGAILILEYLDSIPAILQEYILRINVAGKICSQVESVFNLG